jgi:hypothetical protein
MVGASGGQGMPIRTESHRHDGIGVAGQGAQQAGMTRIANIPALSG